MLVEEVSKAATGPPKKAPRGGLYGRQALDSSAQQARVARHLLELEQDNYHAVQIEIPKPESTPTQSNELTLVPPKHHKLTPNVRKLLATRKTLTNLLDEAGYAADMYRDAAVKPGKYQRRSFCTVCGYWGLYRCAKCGDRYCSETCMETHRGSDPQVILG
jgi:zinc finger HIT domain-containing protein 1